MSDKKNTDGVETVEDHFLTNKELEKTIETIIKKDTPNREVYFDNRIIHDRPQVGYRFKVFTKNLEDPFALLLKEGYYTHHVAKNDKTGDPADFFEELRYEFLEELRQELLNKEDANSKNRYFVKWHYKVNQYSDPVERTSHFMGNHIRQVVDKLEQSIPSHYDFKIYKIELLPES